MGVRSYVKNTLKSNADIKRWASWDSIKQNSKVIGGLTQDLKVTQNNVPVPVTNDFETMMKKMGMSEADIRSGMRSHLIAAIFCAVFGLSATGWTIFLISKGMYLSGLMAFSVAMLMFAYGFREHFSYFQMKQRKLNCTVNEWFSSLFDRKK